MPPSPAKVPTAPPPPKRKTPPAAATKTPTAATRSATVETALAPQAVVTARPIKYPLLAVDTFTGANAMTEALVKKLIGWETEAEFGARMGRATGTAPSAWKFTDAVRDTTTGKSIEFVVDMDGNKAVMWHNTENRPLDLTWCKSLAEGEILERHWAGELTIDGTITGTFGSGDPAEPMPPIEVGGRMYKDGDAIELPRGTVNGSTICISRTGQWKSGQHSGVALIFACQLWRKNPLKYPGWTTEPVIETIVVSGVSDDRDVAMTVDNVRPRSETDVFYTSGLFDDKLPSQRKEYARMLATAADFLWDRTDTQGYRTHSEVVAFVDRHKHLLQCVAHLFEENPKDGGRPISNLRLSPGQSAALCYIMGCSETDGDVYRNGNPPSEDMKHERKAVVSWSNWEKAREFWAKIGAHATFLPVRAALQRLVDSDQESETNVGLGGRQSEKLCVLAKAWAAYAADIEIFEEDLRLRYSAPHTDNAGKYHPPALLDDAADFGGIDVPPVGGKDVADGTGTRKLTPAEQEVLKEQIKAENRRKAEADAQSVRDGVR